ncbi:hypothetical protein SAMD00019534_023140 [Acytostelium subglobosum LB1]|uniref:hypothetical protein n=1 Tax=Acytostelium subglobosum LB1 TaxID=1410327 RepID=UPI000644C8ED|nr:hypothetical protein SAMD00019534_023140 [Acytostelium subglobosum LB1]GAM19139.1 hypothetical protein SAMD00019534_023140 [Acytostelium subglobosum LB1]|eukprot:XP_012757066.1 hypothetical protein SAMD00019534_023140 [Acytostelium subglobosum LB1]
MSIMFLSLSIALIRLRCVRLSNRDVSLRVAGVISVFNEKTLTFDTSMLSN